MSNRIMKTVVNDITGEVQTIDFYSKDRDSLIKKKKYHIVYDEFFEKLMLLSGSENKVLSWLILNSNNNNFIKISYKDLANKMNLSLQRIKEIMSKLKKYNFVKNVGGIIYINPYYFSKAKNKTGQLQFDLMPIFKENTEG